MRIFLLVLSASVLTFCCFILYDEFTNYNFLEKLTHDLTLLIPLHLTLFSFLSIVYGIKKFIRSTVKKSPLYKFLRVSDFVFAISLFLFAMFGGYYFTESLLSSTSIEFDFGFFLIRLVVILMVLLMSILLFIDNLKFHKATSKSAKKDFIDDIGQRNY